MVVLGLAVGCGDGSPTAPTPVAPTAPTTPDVFTLSGQVTDRNGSRVSEVIVRGEVDVAILAAVFDGVITGVAGTVATIDMAGWRLYGGPIQPVVPFKERHPVVVLSFHVQARRKAIRVP